MKWYSQLLYWEGGSSGSIPQDTEACQLIDPNKVAIYIRWSTDDQTEGTTLDIQREACRHYAKSQGWNIPDERIFIDEGYSGGTLDRPGMKQIRERVRHGDLECVIIYAIDRLSRNIVDAVNLVLREWDQICAIKCVTQPIDTTQDLGRVIFSILATFADFERAQIRSRTSAGRTRRAMEARNPGMPIPFGYKRGATVGSFEIDEERAPIVRQIFEWYLAGKGFPGIAKALNRAGVKTLRGHRWGISTIQVIIQNPLYSGLFIFGRTRKNDKFGKISGATPRTPALTAPIQIPGGLPAIIDQATWDRCQHLRVERGKVLQNRETSGRAVSSDHLLTGIARCACGHYLRARVARNNNRITHYICPERANRGPHYCDSGHIRQADLDEFVTRTVRQLVDAEVQSDIMRRAVRDAEARLDSIRIQMATIEKALKGYDLDEARFFRDYRSGQIDGATYQKLMSNTATDREQSRTALQEAHSLCAKAEEDAKENHMIRSVLMMITNWDSLSVPERKQVLRGIFGVMVFFRKAKSKDPVTTVLEFKARFRPIHTDDVLLTHD